MNVHPPHVHPPHTAARTAIALLTLGLGVSACMAPTPDTDRDEPQPEGDPRAAEMESEPEPMPAPEWTLAIHGGAGSARRDATDADAYHQALAGALALGSDMLAAGEASLQVVEDVVATLEDDPRFNAGRGSVFTAVGLHELDAAIMDGRTLACGAVAGVRNVQNPVRLARLVMEETPHVFLGGAGADDFAVTAEATRRGQAWFTTEAQLERFRQLRTRTRSSDSATDGSPNMQGDYTGNAGTEPEPGDDSHLGTVGAVAMDRYGNVAAATSTGGTMNKRVGRIGDVPVIGAGTYANNRTAAISCTGRGEEFIRHTVAHDVSALMEYGGLSVGEAARKVVGETLRPGDGGLIAVSADGAIAMEFNTNAMFRGAADSSGRFDVGIWDELHRGRPAGESLAEDAE